MDPIRGLATSILVSMGGIDMKRHFSVTILGVLAVSVVVGAALSAQDRAAAKSPNGIAFSEFKGYGSWETIAPSQPDDPGGCGESKDGCIKSIVETPR